MLLAVLAVAPAQAEAACAWVLWQQKTDLGTHRVEWTLLDSTSMEQDCQSMAHRSAASTKETLGVWGYTLTSKSRDPLIFTMALDERVTLYMLKCIPDTIDPRGPKGAMR